MIAFLITQTFEKFIKTPIIQKYETLTQFNTK